MKDHIIEEYKNQIASLKEENRMLHKKYRSMYKFCLTIIKISQSISRLGELSK